ncbi:MAG TPA: hypothetical protein DHW49_04555 [Anaerolineae bacterium]|mgnify:CR=1 FL=1|nr:hypothetical protein [Anaerolineae bacterium]
MKKSFLLLICLTLLACTPPIDAPQPPTQIPTATLPATFTLTPTIVNTLSPTQTPFPTSPPDFCADIRGSELINTLSQAIANKDGELLASLVSPSYGMDVRYYRDGNVINYDVEHAEFVFETTFEADWGISFGSGEVTKGSFQEIILPSLSQVFTPASLVVCNQIQTGGVTYFPEWGYPGMNYYSVYFPGTEEFGYLDWQTWAVGMDVIAGKPYIAALSHFVWEP